MRLDVSSQHPRTPNFLLDHEVSDLDEDLLTNWQIFVRAEGKRQKTFEGYVGSMRRLLLVFPTAGWAAAFNKVLKPVRWRLTRR